MGRWIRVLAYFTAAQLGLGAWAVHGALAEAREQLASVGEGAFDWATREGDAHHQHMVINGLRVDVETSMRGESVAAVIDRVRSECRRAFAPTWQALWEGTVLAVPLIYPVGAPPPTATPVLGQSNEQQGYVACLELPPPLQAEGLGTWARRFIAGGQLSVPGAVRYTMVRRTSEGSSIVSLVTRGPLRPAQFLGVNGDVPHPPLQLPRPTGSRVTLHAASDAAGPTVVVFEVANDDRGPVAGGMLETYTAELHEQGFATTPPSKGDGGTQWTSTTDAQGERHFIFADRHTSRIVIVR